jgi:hypothetical protein
MATRETGPATVKRSVTLRNDVDAGIQKLAGRRGYSAFINDAAILALQAQAVDDWLGDYEQRTTPLTSDDDAWARERLAAARNGTRP